MKRTDNYALQAQAAKKRFLGYDQAALIRKFSLKADGGFLYTALFSCPYRICRVSGDMERFSDGQWVSAGTHAEIMTILDLLCDSREDRHPANRYKSMQSFGMMFHQNLLEDKRDPLADRFDRDPQALHSACAAMGGKPFPGADIGYAVPVFDSLTMVVQFWHGDEEFYPRLRYLWDENALQYIRYETMYYAVGVLGARLSD